MASKLVSGGPGDVRIYGSQVRDELLGAGLLPDVHGGMHTQQVLPALPDVAVPELGRRVAGLNGLRVKTLLEVLQLVAEIARDLLLQPQQAWPGRLTLGPSKLVEHSLQLGEDGSDLFLRLLAALGRRQQ